MFRTKKQILTLFLILFFTTQCTTIKPMNSRCSRVKNCLKNTLCKVVGCFKSTKNFCYNTFWGTCYIIAGACSCASHTKLFYKLARRKLTEGEEAEAVRYFNAIEDFSTVKGLQEMSGALLYGACAWENKDLATTLVHKGAEVNYNGPHKVYGYSTLHWACERGYTQIVSELIEKGAPLEAKDNRGLTPLLLAYDVGHIEIVRLLVENGADADAVDKRGDTILNRICFDRETDRELILFFIEKGADVHTRVSKWISKSGKPILHWAYGHNCPKIVRALIEKGADVDAGDEDGWTLLVRACYCFEGDTELISSLIEKGADVNARDINGETPFTLSGKWKDAWLARYLIEHGADITARCGKDGKTALDVAREGFGNPDTDKLRADIDKLRALLSEKDTEEDPFAGFIDLDIAHHQIRDAERKKAQKPEVKEFLDALSMKGGDFRDDANVAKVVKEIKNKKNPNRAKHMLLANLVDFDREYGEIGETTLKPLFKNIWFDYTSFKEGDFLNLIRFAARHKVQDADGLYIIEAFEKIKTQDLSNCYGESLEVVLSHIFETASSQDRLQEFKKKWLTFAQKQKRKLLHRSLVDVLVLHRNFDPLPPEIKSLILSFSGVSFAGLGAEKKEEAPQRIMETDQYPSPLAPLFATLSDYDTEKAGTDDAGSPRQRYSFKRGKPRRKIKKEVFFE